MLEELIKQGEGLMPELKKGMAGHYFDSVNFETWVAKSVLYLETTHKESIVTEKIKTNYKSLNGNGTYAFYRLLLGSLKAMADSGANQAAITKESE
ncbi:hypothetical protein F8158_06850 [Bacillus cereus]|uniref:Uncharacterized protein n=1 Tax=Bacillus cereus TaxID=1396 RepID=A0AB34D9N2_BACCE|nr:hypothetical protein [Bacillus cereus]KAB2500800.1 hypothetical protein F8158_06850 [Bacillus cereus]MDA2480435.1 hypothetical protein [Bacillus cereus]MDA2497464.1 hypothetical protein [Bacillus cereus]